MQHARIYTAAIIATLGASPAFACGGTAPALNCSTSVALTKGVREVYLANTPVSVPVSHGVYLGVAPPAGAPGSSCPAGPSGARLTLTADCDVIGTGVTTTTSLTLAPNALDVGSTVMNFPDGPPRVCRITGEVASSTVLANGVGIRATGLGDAMVCFVEEAPNQPGVPRLDLEQIDIDNELVDLDDLIGRAHPGDPSTRFYRITNHDDQHGIELTISVDSQQTARFPDPGAVQTLATRAGAGIHAISDPGDADDFPISFRPDTPCNDCVPLVDPLLSIDPVVDTVVRLEAGESTVISVATRSWGMCADGSCGESTILAAGLWDDGSDAVACATAAHVADDSVPATWAWPDSGATAEYRPLPGALDVSLMPSPTDTWLLQSTVDSGMSTLGAQLPFLGPASGELLNRDWGRLHEVFGVPPALAGPNQVQYRGMVQYVPVPGGAVDTTVIDMFAVPGAPAGFNDLSPMSMGMAEVLDATSGVRGRVELFGQMSMWAQDMLGNHYPVQIQAYDVTPAGNGYMVEAIANLPGTAAPIQFVHVLNDQRMFAFAAEPPVCEEDLILITDDFELGEMTHFYVEGADPGADVLFLRSTVGTGSGPCMPGFGTPCAGILSPISTFTRTADARGVVEFNITVPNGAPVGDIWWQAVNIAGADTRVSNVAAGEIVP